MANNSAIRLRIRVFSLVLVQMIVAVVLGILFIFVLNKYYDTTNFNISLNIGRQLPEQNADKSNHQEFDIHLKDFENDRTAKGNIVLNSKMEEYKDFSSFLDNCFGFNTKVLNTQINLQLTDNSKLNEINKTLDTSNLSIAENNQFYGQVTANGLNLREGPSMDSRVFYVLNNGEVLKIFGKIGKWYMVYSYSKKLTGSVYAEYIKQIK